MSSLKDLASLIMIPSLVKDGRLDTVKPLGNSIIHPDATGNNDGTDGSTPAEGNFTFSRGSNLAATRVDVNGLIEKGRENLALSSNDISTQSTFWGSNQGGVTTQNSAVAPDGTTTASTITSPGTQYGGVNQVIPISASRYTYSVYLKSVSGTPLVSLIYTDPNGLLKADFNLSTSWQRYDFTFTATTGNNSIYITSAQAVSWNAWGAQFELGLVSTSLIETGASTAQAGILEDLPRLDYSGGASCPSLLLEPQRTNVIPHSEYFGASSWLKLNASVVDNATTSPEGVQNAAKLVEDTSNGLHYIRSPFMTSTDGSTLTTSLFVKAAGRTQIRLQEDAYNAHLVTADLVAQSVTTSGIDAGIEPLENGWFRIYIIDAARPATRWQIRLVKDDTASYQGDGTSGMYIYGFQFENNASYPTSYIPTYGSAVTRLDDDCRASGIEDYIGKNEGTIFVDVDIKEEVNTESYFMRVDASSFSDTIYIVRNTDKSVSGVLRSNNSTIFNQWLPSQSGRIKAALAYKSGDFAFYINGTEVATSSATYSHSFVYNDITLGEYKGSTAQMSGLMKQALVFKTRLTNAELAALTTI